MKSFFVVLSLSSHFGMMHCLYLFHEGCHPRQWQMAALRQLEPEELIQVINKGHNLPRIDSLGSSCVQGAI